MNMSPQELAKFKKEMLTYSERNLIKITAYIEKVFAVKYITDEVKNMVITVTYSCR